MTLQPEYRLYKPTDLPDLLQLSQEQIDWLVRTGQLNPVRIAGEIRFHARELDGLVDTYLQVAKRKQSNVQ